MRTDCGVLQDEDDDDDRQDVQRQAADFDRGLLNRYRLRIGPFGCDDDGLGFCRGEHRDFGVVSS